MLPRFNNLLRHFSVQSRMSLPKTIMAIVAPRTGDVDVMELAELPFPKQQPNEVVVKILWSGINFIDTYIRGGIYPSKSLPIRLGTEGTGIIVSLPTDENVLNDPLFKKRAFKEGSTVALQSSGTLSEYLSVPWTDLSPVPSTVSAKDACAAFKQGLTALTTMTESHNVQKGETIFVHTVAGGLGLNYCQIAKARGATVIGTTSTPEKAELAKSLGGADHVILYTKEDTVKRALELTKGEGAHAIYDGVGKDTFDNNFKFIRRKGTIISIGNASGVVPPFSPLKLVEKNVKLLRPTVMNYMVTPEEIDFYTSGLFDLLEKGVIKIKIHKEYPFTAEGIQQSHKDLVGRSTIGKLIVKVADA